MNLAWRRTLNIVMMVNCERGGWGEKHEGRQQVWPRWLEMKVWDLSPCSAQCVESGGEQIEPWDASWYWLSVSVCFVFGFWFLFFFLYISALDLKPICFSSQCAMCKMWLDLCVCHHLRSSTKQRHFHLMQQKASICLFFPNTTFISNISHAYEQSKWYTRGTNTMHEREKIKMKRRNKKTGMKRNEKRDKCEN